MLISNFVVDAATESDPAGLQGVNFYTGSSLLTVPGVDYSHDGRSDVIWQNASGVVAMWNYGANNSRTDYSVSQTGVAGAHLIGTSAWLDINGDGHNDMLWDGPNGALTAWIWNGTDAVSYTSEQIATTSNVVAVGDFDGDGRTDVLNLSDSQTFTIWDNLGANSHDTFGSLIVNSAVWNVAGVGDFNADTKADIVWRNAVTNDVVIFQSQPGQSAGYAGQDLTPGPVLAHRGRGRHERRRKADIVWYNDNGLIAVFGLSWQLWLCRQQRRCL